MQYKYLLCSVNGQPRDWQGFDVERSFTANGLEMTLEDDDGEFRRRVGQDEEGEEEARSAPAGLEIH